MKNSAKKIIYMLKAVSNDEGQLSGTSSDILKLSTDDFTLYISGSSENKKFKATNNNKKYNGTFGSRYNL